MRFRFFPLILAVCAMCCVAGSKKKPQVTVRFYAEASKSDGDSFSTEIPLLNGQGTIRLSKMASVSERDIQAFYPFQSADGSIGAYFFLDQHGILMLDTLSIEQRGKYLVAVMNGRHVVDLMIDKRVSDGVLVVPSGLLPEELQLLRQTMPVKGAAPVKKR